MTGHKPTRKHRHNHLLQMLEEAAEDCVARFGVGPAE